MSQSRPTTLKGGRYTLLRQIGEGSQGETYEASARDSETRPPARVAIKCFDIGAARAWKEVELAEREARTLESLDHPNLPTYIDHFEEDGVLYLVMGIVEGESLSAQRLRHHTSSVAEVSRMLHDIGEALRYLSSRAPAVVHRDIKPSNIIRRPDGSYALVDFGSVRDRLRPETGGTIVGTFGYMAPEQFQGRASPRSDLYGLGATAMVMLTGTEPTELPHVGLGIDVESSLPAATPRSLVRALTSMLVPDPEGRASSVEAVLAILRGAPEPEKSEPERREPMRLGPASGRRRRAVLRARRLPLLPRIAAQAVLFLALVVVWGVAGFTLPLVLGLLAHAFGRPMRRASSACQRAASRAEATLDSYAAWLAGHESSLAHEELPTRIRVASIGAMTERVYLAPAAATSEDDFERGKDADEGARDGDERARHTR